MPKLSFWALLCALLSAQIAHADALPTSDCDTVITTKGQTLFVQWSREDKTHIYFYDCGGSTWKEQSLPRKEIRSVGHVLSTEDLSARNREIATANYLARKSLLLGVLSGMAFLGGLMIWWPLIFAGFVMSIAGWVVGRRGMRFSRNKPHLKDQYRLSWYGALPGKAVLTLLLVYLLAGILSLAIFLFA